MLAALVAALVPFVALAGCLLPPEDPPKPVIEARAHESCNPVGECHVVDVFMKNQDKRNYENLQTLWRGVGEDNVDRPPETISGPPSLPPGGEATFRVSFLLPVGVNLTLVKYRASWWDEARAVAVPEMSQPAP